MRPRVKRRTRRQSCTHRDDAADTRAAESARRFFGDCLRRRSGQASEPDGRRRRNRVCHTPRASDIVMLRDADSDGRADVQRVVGRRSMLHGLAFKDRRAYFVGVKRRLHGRCPIRRIVHQQSNPWPSRGRSAQRPKDRRRSFGASFRDRPIVSSSDSHQPLMCSRARRTTTCRWSLALPEF